MREKKSNLTSRGRRMLIMALTVTGCVVGVAAAVMISAACRVKGRGAYAPAGKNDAAAVIRESAADNQQESNIEHSSESISPQWIFYQSHGGKQCGESVKTYLDTLVNRWTKGKLTDNELADLMTDYLTKQGTAITTSGIQSKVLCLFSSSKELPDYTRMLTMGESIYDFIGVYTQGEHDEDGRLICYYWEAGVR